MTIRFPFQDNDETILCQIHVDCVSGWYRSLLHWDVTIEDELVHMRLSRGTVAFVVPCDTYSSKMRFCHSYGLSGPTVLVHGETSSFIILADANDSVISQDQMPPGVRLLRAPSRILLPPSSQPGMSVQWLVAPTPNNRWLPLSDSVVALLNHNVPRRLPDQRRGHGQTYSRERRS